MTALITGGNFVHNYSRYKLWLNLNLLLFNQWKF